MQLYWWCYVVQATDIITNVHKQILAHNAAFMVYVVMLLWLLMGSPTEVENKGLSAWPDNKICIVWYTLTNGFYSQALWRLCTHLHKRMAKETLRLFNRM